MRIPFLSIFSKQVANSADVMKSDSAIQELKVEQYQAVAGGPQITNNPPT